MLKKKSQIRQKRVAKSESNTEIIFMVEEALEGGFVAKALGTSIFTEADDLEDLHDKVRDAVQCHFEEGKTPKIVRLHFVHEEVLAV